MTTTTLVLALSHSGISLVDEEDTDWCSGCQAVTIWQGEHCSNCCREWGSDSIPGLQNNGVIWKFKQPKA